MVETVLVYMERRNGDYLVMFKDKDVSDPNFGKVVGIGGHIKEDEDPKEALFREVKEETGFTLKRAYKAGVVIFVNGDYREKIHLYRANYRGPNELGDCDEGTLFWTSKAALLKLPIWDGDKIFLRKLINGENDFLVRLYYDGDKLIRSEEL